MNQQILKLIANRIEAGKRTYPEELDVNDGRDWIQESIESAIETLTGNYPEKVEENCDSTWFKADGKWYFIMIEKCAENVMEGKEK